eukprot:1986505-Rhodomonas_salina.2
MSGPGFAQRKYVGGHLLEPRDDIRELALRALDVLDLPFKRRLRRVHVRVRRRTQRQRPAEGEGVERTINTLREKTDFSSGSSDVCWGCMMPAMTGHITSSRGSRGKPTIVARDAQLRAHYQLRPSKEILAV